MQPKGVEQGALAAAAGIISHVKAGHPTLEGILRIVIVSCTGGRDEEGAAHAALATAATSLPAAAHPALGAGSGSTRGTTTTAAQLPYLQR